SVPAKRSFSSSCCSVIAFGYFLSRFGSGRIAVMLCPPRQPTLSRQARVPQRRFDELQPVVSPEAALAHEDGGNAEYSARERQVGVLAQVVLDLLVRGAGDEALAVESRGGERALHDARVGDVLPVSPVGAKQSGHGDLGLCGAPSRDGRAERQDGADGERLGNLHGD